MFLIVVTCLFMSNVKMVGWAYDLYRQRKKIQKVSFLVSGNAYVLPWWRQLIWSVLFAAMATTATCGNLVICKNFESKIKPKKIYVSRLLSGLLCLTKG